MDKCAISLGFYLVHCFFFLLHSDATMHIVPQLLLQMYPLLTVTTTTECRYS